MPTNPRYVLQRNKEFETLRIYRILDSYQEYEPVVDDVRGAENADFVCGAMNEKYSRDINGEAENE